MSDDILSQWLKNGEMAEHNPELLGKPGTRAVTVQEVDARGSGNQFRYEHDLQVAVFNWADDNVANMPELEMLFAIPNGGHRHKSVAAKMKAEGVKAGYPDIALDVARGQWHGLRIELKVGRNKPTPSQVDWLARLAAEGYKTAVCYDLDSVIDLITEYLLNQQNTQLRQENAALNAHMLHCVTCDKETMFRSWESCDDHGDYDCGLQCGECGTEYQEVGQPF